MSDELHNSIMEALDVLERIGDAFGDFNERQNAVSQGLKKVSRTLNKEGDIIAENLTRIHAEVQATTRVVAQSMESFTQSSAASQSALNGLITAFQDGMAATLETMKNIRVSVRKGLDSLRKDAESTELAMRSFGEVRFHAHEKLNGELAAVEPAGRRFETALKRIKAELTLMQALFAGKLAVEELAQQQRVIENALHMYRQGDIAGGLKLIAQTMQTEVMSRSAAGDKSEESSELELQVRAVEQKLYTLRLAGALLTGMQGEIEELISQPTTGDKTELVSILHAWAHLKAGNVSQASTEVQDLSRRDHHVQDHPLFLTMRGLILLHRGEIHAGLQDLRAAAAKDPHSPIKRFIRWIGA